MDTPHADRPRQVADIRARMDIAPRLSVIVPVCCDSVRAYAQLRLMAPLRRCGVEVIAVAAGSTDGTAAFARRAASRLLAVPGSRARQYNVAAAFARGDVLLLLPPDVLLPVFADQLVEQALETADVRWGWFDIRLGTGLRRRLRAHWLLWLARARRQLCDAHPVFVLRETFLGLGGVPPEAGCVPRALAQRLARAGMPFARAARPALSCGGRAVAPWLSMAENGELPRHETVRYPAPGRPAPP